jgi:hypothetical protein
MQNLAKFRVPMSTQSAQDWANQSGLSGNFPDYRVICSHLGIICHKTQSGKVALTQAITQARKKSGENSVAVPVANQENSSNTHMYTPPSPTPVSSGAAPANDSAVTAATLMQQAISLLGVAGQPSTTLSAEQITQVLALIQEHAPKPTAQELVVTLSDTGNSTNVGAAHHIFPQVLRIAAKRNHVYLYGPAGTGKSHLASQVAEALNLPFGCMSFCGQSTKTDLVGYMDAHGNYVSTPFYDLYKNGGVFCLDEMDAANPNLINLLNGGLAGKQMAFPCGMVTRHADFVCIASANTFGTGATEAYIGRNPMDAASMNRFLKIFTDYDRNLESAIFSEAACHMVWGERDRLKGRNGWVLSMRDIHRCHTFLSEGASEAEVYELCINSQLPQNLRK